MSESNTKLFGVLNINKTSGCTSRDVVNQVQKIVRPLKSGHAGTLDPMATGVLLVCVGPATRLVNLLQDGQKTYVAQFTLGVTSDTDDSTGTLKQTTTEFVTPSEADVCRELTHFVGRLSQVPPDYSAVHINGERAYRRAREGEEFRLAAKEVHVESIQVLKYEWPLLELRIDCGSGTYIRSIARDLGQRLGCGGLMSRLERTAIGPFSIGDAIAIEQVTRENLSSLLHPAIDIVSSMCRYDCSELDLIELRHGRVLRPRPESFVTTPSMALLEAVALVHMASSTLLALAEVNADGNLQPRTVFQTEFNRS